MAIRWGSTSLIVLVIPLISGACAQRWVSAEPAAVETRLSAEEAFERALSAARALGYREDMIDHDARFFRVRAKLHDRVVMVHGTVREITSYFAVQVSPSGSLTVTSSGFYVRRNGEVMHRNLRSEMDSFTAELSRLSGVAARD